jgi:protoporphyrin/coproporphyrin ferrochelatase
VSASADAAVGVLLMAYGGPDSLEDVPGYLADIRAGRPTPRAVVKEIAEHYRLIGGCSPLKANSQRQLAALSSALDPRTWRCYLGMRHWSPWIEEVVGKMAEDGITRAVGIVLAPHYSSMNTERYFQKVRLGVELYRSSMELTFVKSYHDSPLLIDAFARRVQEGLGRWPEAERSSVHVVFCAHSLPVRARAEGDPYEAQLLQTANAVALRAGLGADSWSWSFMSAGRSPEPWMGPDLAEHLEALSGKQITAVLCVPVGFVTDHVEVLHDVDVEARQRAAALGIRLERPPSLDDDPGFIQSLADAVKAQAAAAGFLPAGIRE